MKYRVFHTEAEAIAAEAQVAADIGCSKVVASTLLRVCLTRPRSD
jgi:hypothetical protein